ncbi:MAG: J domain-containing protein [Myxococcota bacterium]
MGIFDRLKRLARSEITEMKRVLSERDDPTSPRAEAEREEDARRRAIREAEAELARDEHDSLADEIEAGAALWRSADDDAPGARPDLDRGASLWGDGGAAEVEPPRTSGRYDARNHAFPREVRDAYAALELPLGGTRADVERAFREMLHRYHPDKHAGDARRQALAHDLTIRIREARDVLATWLDRGTV